MLAARVLRLARGPARLSMAVRSFSRASSAKPSRAGGKILPGLAVAGGLLYLLLRDPPQVTESKRLLKLAQERAEKRDNEQAARYVEQAYTELKGVLKPGSRTVLIATQFGMMMQILDRHDSAVPYYLTAMMNVKRISRVSDRSVVGLALMDLLGKCYLQTGDYAESERVFKRAMETYDKHQGVFSLSEANPRDQKLKAGVDMCMTNVLLHYAQLLHSMDRRDEIPRLRQRVVHVLRSSSQLRQKETTVLDQFDDMMVLHTLRDARRRGHPGELRLDFKADWEDTMFPKK